MSNWYVITGAASTGKTTLINALAEQGYHTVYEAATAYMQAEFEKGHTLEELRKDEKSFQLHIAEAKASLEAHEDSSRLTFFDRGMQETVAFLQHFNIPTDTATDNLMRASDYKKVFLLEPLDVFENSIYRPADKEDLAFVHQFNTLLDKVYTNYGYTPVRVPPFSVPKRVQFILDNL